MFTGQHESLWPLVVGWDATSSGRSVCLPKKSGALWRPSSGPGSSPHEVSSARTSSAWIGAAADAAADEESAMVIPSPSAGPLGGPAPTAPTPLSVLPGCCNFGVRIGGEEERGDRI
jgi:hypothetical protein